MIYTPTTHPIFRHTPGPWDYDMDYIVAPDPEGRYPDIYIAEIAHSDDEGRIAPPEQQDANRRLIAAAADLLEAIPPLIGLIHRLLPARAQSDSTLDNLAEVLQARAAIAKATCLDCDWR